MEKKTKYLNDQVFINIINQKKIIRNIKIIKFIKIKKKNMI